MNPERVARAYEKISEGYAELALALLDTPGVGSPGQSAGREPSTPVPPQASAPLPASPPSFDELPPDEWVEPEPLSPKDPRPVHADVSLGYCPTHHVKWIVRKAGVSKAGKPYKAFFKCPEKDGDVYCNEKPVQAWVNAHKADLERAA